MQTEVMAWAQCVASFTGEAAIRRNALLHWWGEVETCPMGLYFTVRHNRLAGCQQGQCKASRLAGRPLWPCGATSAGEKEQLVPAVLRPKGTVQVLFGVRGGEPCAVPEYPGSKPGGESTRRGSAGAAAKAQRTVKRWEEGKTPDAQETAEGESQSQGAAQVRTCEMPQGPGSSQETPRETPQEFFNRTGRKHLFERER